MKFDPRPWQPPMMEHMAQHDRCGVFAAMGSGKTVATLDAEQSADLLDRGPVLILAPKRVAVNTWPDNLERWDHLAGLTCSVIVGSAAERAAALKVDANFYTCNYDNLPWLVERLGRDWPFKSVVADELTRLKGHRLRQGGKRTAALARVAFSHVERFIGLTGTPAPNGYKDLWGQLWFLDKGQRLGRSFDAYIERWFRRTSNGFGFDTELMPGSKEQIDAAIRDICITIDPRDYGLKLDEPIVTKVEIELPSRVRAQYRQMERHFFAEIGAHEIEAAHAGAKSLKLLQFAAGAVYTDLRGSYEIVHDEKIDALRSIVEEANGMPVLVAYQFQSDLARLLKAFPAGRHLDAKKSTITDWNAGRIPVLFAHAASAGHGLDLQDGGNILAYFNSGWDLELDDQILERLGPLRQMQAGHDRPVYVYRIVAKDTIDEDVLLRHATKRSVQDLLLEAMKRRA